MSDRVQRGATLVVDVESVDERGRARARTLAGSTARLKGVLPTERVEMLVEHVGRDGTIYGALSSVLSPAPNRVEVTCPHYLECGGCDLLHADLSYQHVFKWGVVARALGLDLDTLDDVIASPETFGYRGLAKLVVGPNRVLGSYRPRTHEVVDMRGCLVHAPEVERVVDFMRDALSSIPADALRYVLVRGSTSELRCVVTLVSRREDCRESAALAARLRDSESVARVVLHVNDSPGDAILGSGPSVVLYDGGTPVERIGLVEQSLESGAFSQINPGAAARLYAHVAQIAAPEGKRFLDLYAGSGGIGLTLAASGAKAVFGCELNADAVGAANRSAARMGLDAIARYEAGSVEAMLERAPEADLVVINPPRKGVCDAVIEQIAARAPWELVYVSCNPETLARDLESLRTKAVVELLRVTPVDLFPHTRHVETVVHARVLPSI